MKAFCKKISDIIKTVFGYGVMACLFAGGLTFFVFIAAIFIGGAQVNGSYAAKDPTVYTIDEDINALVATVVDDEFVFGVNDQEDTAALGTVEHKGDGTIARFYTINDGNTVSVGEPSVDTAYKFGIPDTDGKVHFLTGKMNESKMATTTEPSEAIDVYLAEEDDSYVLYTPTLDENGNVIDGKKTYINMVYSGGKGEAICTFISKKVFPIIIYTAVIMVLLGLVAMYFSGEKALTPEKKHSSKHEGEM